MKTGTFQLRIRANKEKLIAAGLNQYAVRSWGYGYRTPTFENALIIARVLNIQINEIPYRQVIINRP